MEALLRRGASPAGLAARDTLRTEVCYHLYGNDLSPSAGRSRPASAGAAEAGGGYIGAEAVRAVREPAPSERLVPFVDRPRRVARPGDPSSAAAWSRAGPSRRASAVGIGMAYLPAARAPVGSEFEIDVRGKMRRARVKQRPL